MDQKKRKRRPRKSGPVKSEKVFTSSAGKKSDYTPGRNSHKDQKRKELRFDPVVKKPVKSEEEGIGSAPVKKPSDPPKKKQDNLTRLNKFVASSGLCSRREADVFIKEGKITVNDEVITEMGVKVKPGDVVKYEGKVISAEKKIYILLNKPKDYITTTDDPDDRKNVLDLLADAGKSRVFPVGRLDRNTTGVLLLTNDGELTSKLTHPKYNQKKIYHVFLDKNLKAMDMKKLASGITLEDGFIKPDGISYVNPDNKSEVGIEIHSGRNRIVRRIFESQGYNVVKLDRVFFAGLTKKNLARGKWRFLTEKEISMLKMSS